MWEIEEVQRAGTIVLIFYKKDSLEKDDEVRPGEAFFKDVRGQIICNDRAEADKWQTVLTTLNSIEE